MKKFIALLLLLSTAAYADAPVIWNGTTAKWLPSGLRATGVQKTDANGVITSSPVGNADISAGASIAHSKMAPLTASKIAVTDASGVVTAAAQDASLLDGLNYINNKWDVSGNATIGGKLGTTGAENWDLIAGNGTVATIVNTYKGISTSPTVVPADATNVVQFDWRNYVSPSASTTGANHTTTYSELNWDNPSADFDNASGSLIASNNNFIKNGSGTVNYGSALSSSGTFNEGTVTQYKGLTSESGIASGATVSDFYGVVSGLNTTSGILGSYTGYSQYANFTDSPMSATAQGVSSNLNFSGTTSQSQGVNGFNSYLQFNDTASVTNSVYNYTAGLDLNDNVNLNGLYGVNSFFNLRDNSDAGFVYGLNLGLTQQDAAVSSGTSAISTNYTYGGTGTAGNVNLANLYGRTFGTVDLDSFGSINTNPELEGNSVVDNVTIANLAGQMRGNATFQNITGVNISPQLTGNASATNFTPVGIYPQITGSATLTNGFTAVQVAPTVTNATGVTSAAGLNVDMNSVTLAAASVAAGEKVKAITFNGALEGNSNYAVPGAASFFQNHYMGGAVSVTSGDPVIGAYGFGTNLAQSLNFQDDWGADPAGLGFVNVGFVGAISGATGKTMNQWTGALGGAGNPSGAGTLTTAKMFSAAGILPQGGSLTVTNMYGFEVNPNLFCILGTNCWGFYEDTAAAENHVSKLAIGTATKKVANADTALEIGSTKGFVNGRMTTAQRTALTAIDGMQVYDTDLDALYIYANGSWTAVGSGAGGTDIQEVPTGTIDSSNTAFTLSQTPISNASVKIYLDGVFQRQGTHYTITGTAITFTTAPATGQELDAVYEY